MQTTKPLVAGSITTTDQELVIVLPDREVRVPWQACSPRLAQATTGQRRDAHLSPGGYGIHWPQLDEDLAIGPLVSKRPT